MQKKSNGHGIDTLATEPLAASVQFDTDSMWVSLTDGRRIGVPLAYFPRLLRATPRQRKRYVISGGGTGLHWDHLDEDISVRAMVTGIGDRTRRGRLSRSPGRKAPSRR